jgi:histidinol-phosphate phosphatase family protein
MTAPSFDIVVPTVGRPSLAALVSALSHGVGPRPRRLILVDDRRDPREPLRAGALSPDLVERLVVLRSGARGPAAARNVGWRASGGDWIAFLDDDVVPELDWLERLAHDLEEVDRDVGGSQGIIRVPLPTDRAATDWERNVHGLERARWATADLAYRREVLIRVNGFDERFPRAYREDADLGLRVTAAGYRIVVGRRTITHHVRPADRWVSVRVQRGNADDALMRALHGRDWRKRAGIPRGRRARHLMITVAAAVALKGVLAGRRRLAAISAVTSVLGVAELAWARIAPGPRTSNEITMMLATSAVIPFAATWHWSLGWLHVLRTAASGGHLRSTLPRLSQSERGPFERTRAAAGPIEARRRPPRARRPRAVLFDRDGTLVVDVPYNGDPTRVELAPGARQAIDRLRDAGVALAIVSNQSGVGRGLLTLGDVAAVNRRIEELLGPLGPWLVCPHGPHDGCDCRKPAPGLVLRAAAMLGVGPEDCVVIGDTGADVEAARTAGARAVLIPNAATRHEEIAAADEVAPDLERAINRVLEAVSA